MVYLIFGSFAIVTYSMTELLDTNGVGNAHI